MTSRMTEAEDERAAVVAFLEREAAEYRDGGSYGQVSFAVLMQAARAIERTDHLKETKA